MLHSSVGSIGNDTYVVVCTERRCNNTLYLDLPAQDLGNKWDAKACLPLRLHVV